MELEEHVGQRGVVHAMDALSLNLGGFISQTFTGISSDDDYQSSFDLSQFELFLAGEVTENLTYFTILEFKRQAKMDETDLHNVVFQPISKDAELELAWFNYRHDDWHQIRIGRFITPHGIINIEHFHPTLLHIPYPLFMRQGKSPTFFHRFLIGVQLHGSRYVGPCEADRLEYQAYVGTQKESGSEYLFGARVNYTFGESGLTVGLDYGNGPMIPRLWPVATTSAESIYSMTTSEFSGRTSSTEASKKRPTTDWDSTRSPAGACEKT